MRSIADVALIIHLLKKHYIRKITVSDSSEFLGEILMKHPKLVVVVNHGSQVGAISGLLGLTDQYYQNAGGARRLFGITWRGFYKIPGYRRFVSLLTQVDHEVTFEDAYELLMASDFTDCVIMPEGEFCNFGNGIDVQPFLSPRFIELAIRVSAPVLVVAQKGSEVWSWPVAVNESFMALADWLPENLKKGLRRSRTLNIPKPWRKKLDELRLSFFLYQPRLAEWDLNEDRSKRQRQLEQEANRVRARMQMMVNEMCVD